MHLFTLCTFISLYLNFLGLTCYDLISSSGGSHVGESWRRTGHCGLGRAVQSLGLRTHEPINMDFVVSLSS
jgi:Tyrosyl-DNA phosphodiesterase